jgi:hypothetical protein
VKFELKESLANYYELYEAIRANFRYDEKEYFSFYLTIDGRDDEYALRNTEENTHYDYIRNLLEWNLQEEDIKVNAEIFKSQDDLKWLQDKLRKEYDAARRLVENAVDDLIPAKGQFVVIRPWHSSSLRLGIVEDIRLPGKRQSFSLDLLELKKDLKPGHVKINLSSKS